MGQPAMGGARGEEGEVGPGVAGGGQLPPVPSYLPPGCPPPPCQNNDFRCPTGVFNFCKKQLNVLKFLV